MPVVTLSPDAIRTDTIGSAPPAGSILVGRDHDVNFNCASGVQFDLPFDLRKVEINSATFGFDAEEPVMEMASYTVEIGIPATEAELAVRGLSHDILHNPIMLLQSAYQLYIPPIDPITGLLHSTTPETPASIIDMVRQHQTEAMLSGWDGTRLQFLFRLGSVYEDPWVPFWAELSGLELKIDYTALPLRLSLPPSIRVGQSLAGFVGRLNADPSPLAVSLSHSPSGRLILPATATIAADEEEELIEITGATTGTATVTAAAGAEEHQQEVEILSALPSGLGGELGWWCPSLDADGDGGGTLYDLSGYNHHGTLTGSVAWETNAGARCLSLTSGGHVTMGDLALFDFERTSPFSTSAWILVPSGSSTGIDIVSKMMDASPNRGWSMRINSPSATVMHLLNSYSSNDLTRQVSYATFDPRGATWRHLCVTYDGSVTGGGISIYWDGVLRAATTATSNLTQTIRSSAPLRIGARPGASASLRFDDARIYGRALSAAEVEHLATARGVLGGLPEPPVVVPELVLASAAAEPRISNRVPAVPTVLMLRPAGVDLPTATAVLDWLPGRAPTARLHRTWLALQLELPAEWPPEVAGAITFSDGDGVTIPSFLRAYDARRHRAKFMIQPRHDPSNPQPVHLRVGQ